jgi:hypothetical protein
VTSVTHEGKNATPAHGAASLERGRASAMHMGERAHGEEFIV